MANMQLPAFCAKRSQSAETRPPAGRPQTGIVRRRRATTPAGFRSRRTDRSRAVSVQTVRNPGGVHDRRNPPGSAGDRGQLETCPPCRLNRRSASRRCMNKAWRSSSTKTNSRSDLVPPLEIRAFFSASLLPRRAGVNSTVWTGSGSGIPGLALELADVYRRRLATDARAICSPDLSRSRSWHAVKPRLDCEHEARRRPLRKR